MAQVLHSQSAFGAVLVWMQHFFAEFREAMERRRVYRTTVRDLNALSLRELSDLGLNPSMIRSLAIEAAYGR